MKHLLLPLLLLAACNRTPVPKHSDQPEKPKATQPKLSVQPKNIESSGPSPLFDSLTKDFDLHTFLEKMQFTNNGGAQQEICYFVPERAGFYYSYFGSPHFSGDIFGKLTLTTYIYGNTVGQYNEQDETFIGLSCRVNDPALGNLDLVGKPAAAFRQHPSCVLISDDRILLQENEKLLRLYCRNDTIRSFHYLRVKNHFDRMTEDERRALRN